MLDRIAGPEDVKKLGRREQQLLAKEIRRYLVSHVSKTGGHLSSNLGVVELTIALHGVFTSPADKIIWDVGHQCYAHKILTGRKDRMGTIRQFHGLSGFPKPSESPHDHFQTGHSSTSISVALGMAKARDLRGDGSHVVAVIGDGALTGGMAYEAMNNAGQMKTDLIVVLNDNQMSISKNVGGMALYLDSIRTGSVYRVIKADVEKALKRIPWVGEKVHDLAVSMKNGLKQVLVPGMFFEELGFTYLGPVDGHDMEQLHTVLEQAESVAGPVLVHVKTVKGKGYRHAEADPMKYHGTKPFEPQSGQVPASPQGGQGYSEVFGRCLTELAREDGKVVAITAAMTDGTGLEPFAHAFPERFFDVGIAEQHGVAFAAGLACEGYKPVFAVYSTFLQRAYDQLVHDVCIQELPVVLAVDRAGLVGEDGETHQGVFDVSFLNQMPNMTVMAPADGRELEAALAFALSGTARPKGPVAIRYPRGTAPFREEVAPIVYGRMEVLAKGEGVALVFVGSMMETALELQRRLVRTGIRPTLVNARFIKPLDMELLESLCRNHHTMVVLEENQVIGGLGSEILRRLNEGGFEKTCRIAIYGIQDRFVEHGDRKSLLQLLDLDPDSIWEDLQKKWKVDAHGG
ncbi:1-deoxy-D-xylulose-5-phosphate synthase [Clostridiales bacterium F-3ap]|uniref:1-deoxy-D-xylulose-5-phosphate synthase n=1 Tax=Anaerotalea alkaliphila TaxID=2662126 RepID=A0A7X5HTB1_9FIRM|nr:1-deoxy-D-xylulose-5-phosphate synthase [Anaerotalea alkaliphila]